MGLWTSHRQRQAGRYAKASFQADQAWRRYEWQRDRERARAWNEAMALVRARAVTVEVEVERALPPRPDVG